MPVMMPQKQRGSAAGLGQLGTIVGGVVGGVAGGPMGAVGGAGAGNAIGTGVGSMFGTKSSPGAVGGGNSSAMQRRSESGNPIGGAMQAFSGAQGAMGMGGGGGGAPAAATRPEMSNMSQGSPMQRRMDRSDPSMDLQQAESALAYLPPEQQKAYGPAISQARRMDRGYA